MNQTLAATSPATARIAPTTPATTASTMNGSCVRHREAPTSRMISVSVRRVYAAICTMLEISRNAAIACTMEIASVALRRPLSSENSRSRNALWSETESTPGRPE